MAAEDVSDGFWLFGYGSVCSTHCRSSVLILVQEFDMETAAKVRYVRVEVV
jgi:hypothetical protein